MIVYKSYLNVNFTYVHKKIKLGICLFSNGNLYYCRYHGNS